jgi:hypothetical protein
MIARALTGRNARIDILTVLAVIVSYIFVCYIPLSAQYAENMSGPSPAVNAELTGNGAPELSEGWRYIESDYFKILCSPNVDIKRVERKIRKRYFFSKRPKLSSVASAEERLAYRMDAIFDRAKEILDMRPHNPGITIKIFKNRRELNEEYYSIFKEKRNIISFYIYKHNTIYTNEADISDSVIAHEMGHAIVDHYFAVRPPETVRELLSEYVNAHLDD